MVYSTESFISGNTPQCQSGKILSAKMIEDGTGLSQANEVISSLKSWKAENSVIGHCFDTTASNVGWINGAAVNIEKQLGRPLLWLFCRHHISELFLKSAWFSIFGEDMSPFYEEFKNFKKLWNGLDKRKFDRLGVPRSMKARADRVIEFCKAQLSSGKQARDDYKECLDLVLVLLGEDPPDFTFKLPGACHKARFMMVLIYAIKIYLFRKQLKKNTKQKLDLERFVIFAALYYAEYWFLSPIAANAPICDLTLYRDMNEFEKIDKRVSKAVLEKLELHTWYFNMEYSPFSLFSNRVSDAEKSEIAMKLHNTKPSENYAYGQPELVKLYDDYKLSDSVCSGEKESYLLFLLLATRWCYLTILFPSHRLTFPF